MAKATAKKIQPEPLNALRDCDELVQHGTANIDALALAASRLMAMHVPSLVAIDRLLQLIRQSAGDLQNQVNRAAEAHGANWEEK